MPQGDLSSLSAEQASITFLLSVSGAALCYDDLTLDLPRGQHQVEAPGGLVPLSTEQASITFFFSVSGAALCDADLMTDLPRGQHQVEASGGLVLLVGRTGLDNISTFCIRSGVV
jgi:hypothetical protein